MQNNQITSVEPLKNLKNLSILHLNNNDIVSIEALRNMTSLSRLALQNNKIKDLSPAADFEPAKNLQR